MKKMNAKDILIPTIALFIICLVASVLLAVTNMVTAPKIAEQAVLTVRSSLEEVVTEVDGVAVDNYSDAINYNDSIDYYEAYDENQKVIAYIFTSSEKGYGGAVKVMTAFDTKGTIIGFTVVDCADETPGLGQNSKTHFTKDFFNGKSGELKVQKDGGDIQAITAATITSRAVVAAVNYASDAFKVAILGETSTDSADAEADNNSETTESVSDEETSAETTSETVADNTSETETEISQEGGNE